MQRRDFLAGLTGSALTYAGVDALETPKDLKVTQIVGFDLVSRRPKVCGKNARLDVHGERGVDRMVRIQTNLGVEGIGNCRARPEDLAKLLGTNPLDLFRRDEHRMTGPLGAGTMPLWDLAGKVFNKPACELLGNTGGKQVGVYDGSIYFADLLPMYASRPLDRFKEEVDMGLAAGHRGFKIKIGRGHKWMPPEDGFARDIAVVKTIRKHAGLDILLGVDANNGYDLPRAKRFIIETADCGLAFVEELFPEVVEQCLELKAFIAQQGLKTLLADGETQHELEPFKPFIAARAIDILQGDMNHFGFEGILTEASWARPQQIRVAPHNWGSLVGFYMQLHVGRAIDNFYRAEHDPLANDLLIAEGYTIKDGLAEVPEAPGFGLVVNEAKFADAPIRFDIKG